MWPGRAGPSDPRCHAPGVAPLHPLRPGKPAGRGQRSGPRFRPLTTGRPRPRLAWRPRYPGRPGARLSVHGFGSPLESSSGRGVKRGNRDRVEEDKHIRKNNLHGLHQGRRDRSTAGLQSVFRHGSILPKNQVRIRTTKGDACGTANCRPTPHNTTCSPDGRMRHLPFQSETFQVLTRLIRREERAATHPARGTRR